MQSQLSQPTRPAAWAGLFALAALLVLLAWGIRTLLPSGPSTPPAAGTTQTAEPTRPGVVPTATPLLPASQPALEQSPLLPGLGLALQIELPGAPGPLPLYRQEPPPPASQAALLQTAQQMGLSDWQPFSWALGAPQTSLSNGDGFITAYAFANHFYYQSKDQEWFTNFTSLPYAERAALAEEFLRSRGLLDRGLLGRSYRIEPESAWGGQEVYFTPLLHGLPVIFGIGPYLSHEWASVVAGQDGVRQVEYQGRGFTAMEDTPLLSAAQAWQRLLSPQAARFARFAVQDPAGEPNPRQWTPLYPPDQPQEMYGYLNWRGALAGQPVLTFNSTALIDQPTGALLQAARQPGTVHITGQLSRDAAGRTSLRVDNWEFMPDETYRWLVGRLAREGQETWLELENPGQDPARLRLYPDAPADVPTGETLTVSGQRLEGSEPLLAWWLIASQVRSSPAYRAAFTCGGSLRQGGLESQTANFGGGGFTWPTLAGSLPPDPFLAAYPVGRRLEGTAGQVQVTIYRSENSETRTVALVIDPDRETGFPGGALLLQGTALDGIQASQGLPVLVWGQVQEIRNGQPLVAVERWQPRYPGVQTLRLVGRRTAGMWGGQMIESLATADGSEYILRSSWTIDLLDMTDDVDSAPLAEVEGFIIPGETYSGLPVLYDSGIRAVPDPTQSFFQPRLVDLSAAALRANQVAITQVELAYATGSLQNCQPGAASDPNQAGVLLVQPIWIFRGYLADGRTLEIQVQALPDEYLQP